MQPPSWNPPSLPPPQGMQLPQAQTILLHQAPPASLPPSLLLRSCATAPELHQVHAFAVKSAALHHLPVASHLLSLYSDPKLGSIGLAKSLFDLIPSPNSFCWCTIIKCFVEGGRYAGAIALFRELLCGSEVRPDNFTYPCVIKACALLCAVEGGRQIHGLAIKGGFGSDSYVQGSLVNFYSKCGMIACARKVFDGMPQRDLVVWNSMIDGFVKCGDVGNARKVFDDMPQRDFFSWVTMINGYAKCGDVENARMIFDWMPKKTIVAWNAMIDGHMKIRDVGSARKVFDEMPERNAVSWNSMITGYKKNGFFREALEVFDLMLRSSVVPNNVTLVGALSAAAGLGQLDKGSFVHQYIEERGIKVGGVIATCLIDMYAKCGSIENALEVFRKVPKKKLGQWTAIIVGLGMHGMYGLAKKLFNKMVKTGFRPHPMAFIGVLNACSHTGMVDEGQRYFKLMREEYVIEPALEHYGCLVDLLCRVGRLKEAKEVIESMPMEPNEVIWMSLLSGCRKHGNAEIGQYAAEQVIELSPDCAGCYILLSNIYAASNNWDKVSQVREILSRRGIRKEPGQSTIEYEGAVHVFVAGDRSHPQTGLIYAKLSEMDERLKDAGYVPDLSQVLPCVEDSQKEAELAYHSERLAIAFTLVNLEESKPIRIVKNSRICNDCHNATKLLSGIYGREIIVRDIARFHHFKNGCCSCKDYW